MNDDLTTRARKAIKQIRDNDERASYVDGLLGRINPSGPPTFVPRGRAGYKYVRIGTLPPVPARDNIGVPESLNLPVRVKKEIIVPGSGVVTYSIVAALRDESMATVPPPSPGGIPAHTHDDRYFTEAEHIDVSAGAADAGKAVKLAADGFIDETMLDPDDMIPGLPVGTALAYTTTTTVSATTPSGKWATNNVDFTLTTELGLSHFDSNSDDISDIWATFDGFVAPIIGMMWIQKEDDATVWACFELTGLQHFPATNYDLFNATFVGGSGTSLPNNTPCRIIFSRFGNTGMSAYEFAVDQGFVGDEAAWLASLVGAPGADGDAADIAAEISAAATDNTIVDADLWGYVTGGVLVKTAWSNIKAVLKTYFDTLYNLYVHPNHTGDVASVADGATTIAADAVTNAKLANMAQGTIKGRQLAGGTGDAEDLTAAQLITIIEAQAIYALLAGRAGSQTLNGGTASGESLSLHGSAHATRGPVNLNPTSGAINAGTSTQLDTTAMQLSSSVFTNAFFTTVAAATGSRAEVIQVWKISDSDDFFALTNSDTTNTRFAANFLFRNISSFTESFGISYETLVANDTGSVPAVVIAGYTRTSAQSFGALATRPIVAIRNLSTDILVAHANNRVRIGPTAPRGKLDVDQDSSTAATPTLVLDQSDLSEEFIRFVATVGAGNPIDTAALGTYYGKARVYVEGVGIKYMALYNP